MSRVNRSEEHVTRSSPPRGGIVDSARPKLGPHFRGRLEMLGKQGVCIYTERGFRVLEFVEGTGCARKVRGYAVAPMAAEPLVLYASEEEAIAALRAQIERAILRTRFAFDPKRTLHLAQGWTRMIRMS
jgi:hypothetical protein